MSGPNSDAEHVIVSSSQMKAVEEKMFACGMTVEALMEKVGLEMKNWLLHNSRLLIHGVLVLVGPGNNGGDGLVLARELYLEGVQLTLWCPFTIKKVLIAKHLAYCTAIGIPIIKTYPDVNSDSLWIDALFGLGQTREIPTDLGLLLKKREKHNPGKLISLDVPSGICSDTGKTLGIAAAKASFTLTVGLNKLGLLQDLAIPFIGKLVRIDLGIPKSFLIFHEENIPLKLCHKDIDLFVFPRSIPNASKYERGRTLVIAGSHKYKGAPLLALKGALASGVGSIQAFLPKNISDSIWHIVPEVVFHNFADHLDSKNIPIKECLEQVNFDHFDSLLIGPGLDVLDEKWEESASLLKKFGGLLVLDADALNRIAFSCDGWRWICKRNGPTWITPNLNEFCRLFPEIDVSCKLKAAGIASKITGASVLLKGANSVIATPQGEIWQLSETCPFVARAGLGDVLSGFISGIGALGLSRDSEIDNKLLALSALLHSSAGNFCFDGSNPELIAKTLAKFVKKIQQEKVHFDTFQRQK